MTEYVCASCIGESALKKYIEMNADETYCDYCEESHGNARSISIDDLIEYMRKCVSQEYDNPANWLYYETSEGVYHLDVTFDAYDLILEELGIKFPNHKNDALLQRVVKGFDQQEWCKNDPFSPSTLQVAQFSWDKFSRIVKHENRYYFGAIKREKIFSDELTPGELLDHILDYAKQIDLIKEINAGLILYRARAWDDGKPLKSPEDLGPPPTNKALQPNRMSPAGIPMFYGSEDSETAVLETASQPECFSVGKFQTNRPIVLLDISNVPPLPSIFETDPESRVINPRRAIRFLMHISEEISKPIRRDGHPLIEYVPAQVVTEFIRSRQFDGEAIDGIKYDSAKNPEHSSYVLFATQDNVLNYKDNKKPDRWLELKSVSDAKVEFTYEEIDSIDLDFSDD